MGFNDPSFIPVVLEEDESAVVPEVEPEEEETPMICGADFRAPVNSDDESSFADDTVAVRSRDVLDGDAPEVRCDERFRSLYIGPSRNQSSGVGRLPLLLAAGLGLVTVGGAAAYWNRGRGMEQRPSQLRLDPSVEADDRFLTSDELASTIVDHAIRFHSEADGSFVQHLSHEELRQLKADLVPQATAQSFVMAKKIEAADKDTGRKLAGLQLTDEQWRHTHHLLDALHDKRVQDLGQYVADAVEKSGGDKSTVREKLGKRQEEMRQLMMEVIPASVRDIPHPGQSRWQVAVDADGHFNAHGSLAGWDAALEVGERRLEASVPGPCALPPTWATGNVAQQTESLKNYTKCLNTACEDQEDTTIFGKESHTCSEVLTTFGLHCDSHYKYGIMVSDACPVACGTCKAGNRGLARILWLTIASAVAAIFSVVAMVLTLTLGPQAALIMFIVQASLGGALCGTTLGIAFIPALKHVTSWVPCMIMTTFTGLESIWTFQKLA